VLVLGDYLVRRDPAPSASAVKTETADAAAIPTDE